MMIAWVATTKEWMKVQIRAVETVDGKERSVWIEKRGQEQADGDGEEW
jgi:hypothetical protein